MEDLLAALRQLDPLNDEHWTSNGDPRIDAVKAILGADVDRKTIVEAAPDFNRERAGQPETLLMNQKPDEALVEKVEQPAEEVPQADSAILALELMFGDSSVGPILNKMFSLGPVSSKEMGLVLEQMEPEDVDILVDAIHEMTEKVNTERKKLEKATKELMVYEMWAKKHLDVVRPDMTNQEAISAYIKAQNDARFKAAQARAIVLRNLNPQEITPLAPIDQAFARVNTRGKKRPVYPARQ